MEFYKSNVGACVVTPIDPQASVLRHRFGTEALLDYLGGPLQHVSPGF